MKKTIIFRTLILSAQINSQAQCWDPLLPNTITTDWRATNTSNTWDWTQELFNDFYIKNRTNPVTRYSPFWSPQGSVSSPV